MQFFYRRKVVLEEKAGVVRQSYPVVIKLRDICRDINAINWGALQVRDGAGNLIVSQVDDIDGAAGYSANDEIVFQVSLKANEKKEVFVYYGTDANEKGTVFESDLKVERAGEKVFVENSRFKWELTDAEGAELRLKTDGQTGDSWQGRIWTYAGQGHNQITPMHDFHYQRRRFLNEIRQCEVVSAGPVRAVIRLYYNSVHFEDNLDVERRLTVFSKLPVIEKVSTSVSGEPGIVLATTIGKMGRFTLADGSYCGSKESFAINSPRTYPKVVCDVPLNYEREMNFQPIGTAHATDSVSMAAYKTIGEIDGFTWGAIWNPRSGQGKAEIARFADVKGFFAGWEQDRDASSIHPLTNRAFGDFVFACTAKRTFKHYSVLFWPAGAERSPDLQLDELTKSIANPVEVTVGPEQAWDKDKSIAAAPARLVYDIGVKAGKKPAVNIKRTPEFAGELDTVKIEVQAASEVGIKKVILEYGWETVRFCKEAQIDGEPTEGGFVFEIPAQRPQTVVSYRAKVTDVQGQSTVQEGKYSVLDIVVDCPLRAYVGQEVTISGKVRNTLESALKGHLAVEVNGVVLKSKAVDIKPGQTVETAANYKVERAGACQVKVRIESNGCAGELSRQLTVFNKPQLPYKDFCALLARCDKRTLHGKRLRYWGGQPDMYWEQMEHETIGFTHAWYYDGRSWGSYSQRDWEFWRKEQTAYGSLYDHKTSTLIKHPKPASATWQPGCLELSYEVGGLKMNETKFIKDDVLVDVIKLKNTAGKDVHFSLLFKGKGHGMSEADFDAQTGAILVKNHAYAYTGLSGIFYSSIPFSSYAFSSREDELDAELQKGSLENTKGCYGEPVWYAFRYEFKLKAGQEKEFVLGFTISDDPEKASRDMREIVADPQSAAEAVVWDWNHWFNDQVPRFGCDQEKYNKLYYYVWFAYRCNVVDVGEGWIKYPYVAPTASTYFITMFGWDSAFHTMIGKWLRSPEELVYGNLKNWSLVQSPCGYLPELFGAGWKSTWTMEPLYLLACALYEMYQKTGDAELVRSVYPTLKKYEQWRTCEIEYSPYWMDYHNNIPDFKERREAFIQGKSWVGSQIGYYRRFAELAKWVGDDDYRQNLLAKAGRSREKLLSGSILFQDRPWDGERHVSHIGHELYWGADDAKRQRVEELLQSVFDADKYGMDPPVRAWPLDAMRPGDGWDHGTSVTVGYFLIEGLFRYGLAEPALKLLFGFLDASFIQTQRGIEPTAPEYWDEKAKPWGCIEYAWNGLLNNFIIERVCGVLPELQNNKIVVEPHLPSELGKVGMTIPFGDNWVTFEHEIERAEAVVLKTNIRNCRYDVVLRIQVPAGRRVSAVEVDGRRAEYEMAGEFAEVKLSGLTEYRATVKLVYSN